MIIYKPLVLVILKWNWVFAIAAFVVCHFWENGLAYCIFEVVNILKFIVKLIYKFNIIRLCIYVMMMIMIIIIIIMYVLREGIGYGLWL